MKNLLKSIQSLQDAAFDAGISFTTDVSFNALNTDYTSIKVEFDYNTSENGFTDIRRFSTTFTDYDDEQMISLKFGTLNEMVKQAVSSKTKISDLSNE